MNRFHETAKKWIDSLPNVTDEDWEKVMEEDSQHPYDKYPTTQPQDQVSLSEAGSISPLGDGDQRDNNEDWSGSDHELDAVDESTPGNYVEI